MSDLLTANYIVSSKGFKSESGADKGIFTVKSELERKIHGFGVGGELVVVDKFYSASYSLNLGLDPSHYDFRSIIITDRSWLSLRDKADQRLLNDNNYFCTYYAEEWLKLTQEQLSAALR
ncbi:MAG: hypothetical protein AABW73_01830 [Nanoarchaeota archaeon]